MNTNIGQKIWHFCHTLRDEGMSYGNYIEQLTYLLFLKMADEKGADIPKGCSWADLIKESGDDLMKRYDKVLDELSRSKDVLGDIFANAKNLFRKPVGLKKIIDMINEIDWASIPVDQLGTIYEDLLQRYAEEKKGGAGQYFTPRPLIKAMVQVMKPEIGMEIHDPATGTGGFLISAFEHIVEQKGGKLDPDDEITLRDDTFSGSELVLDTRRLCVMNLFLHGVHDGIEYGDSLAEVKEAEWDMVLTNPPFGVKSGGEVPHRPDFNVETANKQLNFVQHVMSGLKAPGKAAMVLPDNVLFEENTGTSLRKILLKSFNVHTILRLPLGAFIYVPGVKANVVFFDKGSKTSETWVYDMRTNVDKINKGNPLADNHFEDFVKWYDKRKVTERAKKFKYKQIEERNYNLDIKWIKDDSLHHEYEDPDVILENIKVSEEKILEQIENIMSVLQNGK